VVQNTDALVRLEEAVGTSVVAVRLRTSASTVEERLRQRHQGAGFDGLDWHLDRAPELVTIQNRGLKLPIIDASGSISDRQHRDLRRRFTDHPAGDALHVSSHPAQF